MLALIVEETMAVATPGDALHEDDVRLEVAVIIGRDYRLV
jgi:hypothetical protein